MGKGSYHRAVGLPVLSVQWIGTFWKFNAHHLEVFLGVYFKLTRKYIS